MNKILKRTFVAVGVVFGITIAAAVGFVGYVYFSYNRIGDKTLDIDHAASPNAVETGVTYKALSYNIGFGAYSQDFTFFLDTGYDKDGKPTCGYSSKGKSKEEILFNTSGAIQTVKNRNPDFVMFQEVDTNSTRSHFINEDKAIMDAFPSYDHVHAVNFHTAFLPYPLYDMHGVVNGGLTTISKYKINAAERKQYTVSNGFSKFFDLDRCFSYHTVSVSNGKTLYIVNSHMSAYDEGGTIRAKQMEELNTFLKQRSEAGDYVVIGGDWNHDLLTNNPDFGYSATNLPYASSYPGAKLKTPDWVADLFDFDGASPLASGYHVVASDNIPTCRNNDIEWDPSKTFVCCVDGFIVSSNVEVVSHRNILTKQGKKGLDGFAYSDHEPVELEFRLK